MVELCPTNWPQSYFIGLTRDIRLTSFLFLWGSAVWVVYVTLALVFVLTEAMAGYILQWAVVTIVLIKIYFNVGLKYFKEP